MLLFVVVMMSYIYSSILHDSILKLRHYRFILIVDVLNEYVFALGHLEKPTVSSINSSIKFRITRVMSDD